MQGHEIPPSAHALFARGHELLEAGDYLQALPLLESASRQEPTNAKIRSSYGLCLGLEERDFARAVALCDSAVKQEFFNPTLYLNLARLHLAFGLKADGLRHLRRGRMIDPGNKTIADELARLGRRRGPVLRFLPRNHAVNRWFGRALHRVATPA